MEHTNAKILWLNYDDVLPQFQSCSVDRISLTKINADCAKYYKEADMIIFIDNKDENENESYIDKAILKWPSISIN